MKPPVVVDVDNDVGVYVHVHVHVGFDNDADITLCPYGLGQLYEKAWVKRKVPVLKWPYTAHRAVVRSVSSY